jgi:hypothetical protein
MSTDGLRLELTTYVVYLMVYAAYGISLNATKEYVNYRATTFFMIDLAWFNYSGNYFYH